MQKRKVIIVGGGLTGLSAAYELSRSEGFEIRLIEKNARLGGRVSICCINGHPVDTGGFLIYPWYRRYRKLIEVLGLSPELVKIPPVGDYYDAEQNSQDKYYEGFKLSFKDIVEIFIDVFPDELIDTDPTAPKLDAYKYLTIQDYLKSLGINKKKVNFYLSVFDTYLQGYCYGPVTQHKMAFMAATIFQNILHGDVHSASYLRNGSKIFIDALQAELERKGVQFQFNCSLESVNDQQLVTNLGTMTADGFIFCHTPAEVSYSKFITVTISYSGTAQIDGNSGWGSCFYKEDPRQDYSIVNLEKLYTGKTAGHLNLNIKVKQPGLVLVSDADLLSIIRTELQRHFKDISVLALVNRVNWEKAMPIANEDYVEMKRAEQGHNHFYYAGDFMGCPSMETALMSGKRAAEQLIKDQGPN
jgi:protoporphyrinogen oxidase